MFNNFTGPIYIYSFLTNHGLREGVKCKNKTDQLEKTEGICQGTTFPIHVICVSFFT